MKHNKIIDFKLDKCIYHDNIFYFKDIECFYCKKVMTVNDLAKLLQVTEEEVNN